MIDTIKFRLNLNPQDFQKLRKLSTEIVKLDHQERKVVYNFVDSSQNLGSWDRRVNIKAFAYDKVYIEFSLPKYQLGHNIYLLDFPGVIQTLKNFYNDFSGRFFRLSHFALWTIVRLDVCYAWKFYDDKMARSILDTLKGQSVARKKRYVYPDSVMFKGTTYSSKFYLKKPEYYFHDLREVKKIDVDLAYRLLSLSEGVLRFETTLRKKALDYFFEGKTLHITDLSGDIILQILKKYFSLAMRGMNGEFMNDEQVLDRLLAHYTPSKARSLWLFWNAFYSDDLGKREKIKEIYDRRTIWYNLRALSDAQIGLPKKTLKNVFNLQIPSPDAVNEAWPRR